MAEVVAAVRACFESEALCERMEQWAEANAVEIDLHRPMSDGSGHPLRYTQLHREWCDLVETALEAAVEQAGVRPHARGQYAAQGLQQSRRCGGHDCGKEADSGAIEGEGQVEAKAVARQSQGAHAREAAGREAARRPRHERRREDLR